MSNQLNMQKDLLMEQLQEQIFALRSSCQSFDNGQLWEAKRLALTTRILVHDTARSTSLLKHLEVKDRMYFLSTTHPDLPENKAPFTGLVGLRINVTEENQEITYFPHLDENERVWITFDKWWNQIIIDNRKNKPFSRKELVTKMANQDGGAHVDPKMNKEYWELTREKPGWEAIKNGKSGPMTGVELFSMRQVAHEMLRSLKDKFPSLYGKVDVI